MNKVDELKIFYLFMCVDGDLSEKERDNFDFLKKSLEVSGCEAEKVIDYCNNIGFKDDEDNYELVEDELIKIFRSNFSDPDVLGISDSEKLFIIWSLINLGYADGVYSESEKRTVRFIAKFLDVDKQIIDVMVDNADTILALVLEKERLISQNGSWKETNEKINIIEDDINRLYSDIENLISEND